MAQTVINLLKDHLLRRISYHCHILAYYLDPLVTEETSSPYQNFPKQKKSSHWDFTFLFPVLALATSTLYGNVLLVILETGSADLDLSAFQHCPVSMYHQVLPRSMWQQSDISYALSSGTALAIYATFLLNPYTAGRYYLTTDTGLQVDGKKLPPPVSRAILSSHGRIRRCTTIVLTVFTLFTLTFNYVTVLLVNRAWSLGLRDGLLLILLYPLHFLYSAHGLFAVPSFVVLASQFLHLRQRYILRKMERLNRRLQNRKQQQKPSSYHHQRRQFLLLNRCLARVCTSVDRCSRYWAPVLSTYFLGFVAIQCYMAYIVFFLPSLPLIARSLFLYSLLEVEAAQFALVHQCAKLATNGAKLEKACRQFYLASFVNHKNNSKSFALKAEHLQTARRLRPFSMHLLDNYRITSKTFYATITYNATFFLMVFKRQ